MDFKDAIQRFKHYLELKLLIPQEFLQFCWRKNFSCVRCLEDKAMALSVQCFGKKVCLWQIVT